MVIGEVCHRIIAKLFLRDGGAQAKDLCRSVNLCARLEAGIEGAVHAEK